MSWGIYPTFRPELPEAEFDCDGAALFETLDDLDRLAEAVGVRPIGSFGDNRPVPEDFDGEPEELDELLGPWEEWFSAAEGLRTAAGLLTALRDEAEQDEELVEELQCLADCLRTAVDRGAEFRLEVG